MTIQIFIGKAVMGGWDLERTGRDMWRVLLDPLAWKAVGKVEGWAVGEETADMYVRARMHGMIDALVEGKTIEEYLETL